MNSSKNAKALVFNTQAYTIHDGPGIRTEIFFKGCPLNCPWCSNPEGISLNSEPGFYPSRCLGKDKCGLCLQSCPAENSPLKFDERGIIIPVSAASECANCYECADCCPSEAIISWGREMSVGQIMDMLERDRSFFERSGGGVTLSGGEVLLQWPFAAELLRECKKASFNTCLESSLFVSRESMEAVLPYTDLLITDIKYMDSSRHKASVGAPNDRIIGNILFAASEAIPMIIRTPIIPGWNDDEENLLAIAEFIRENLSHCLVQYQLLPYRPLGIEKYESLGREYPMRDADMPSKEEREGKLLSLQKLIAERYDLPVEIGASKAVKR